MTAQLILNVLNMIQAGFTWLTSRGIHKDRIQAMLDAAENGDLTTAQVQTELDALQTELDETAELINGEPGDNSQ